MLKQEIFYHPNNSQATTKLNNILLTHLNNKKNLFHKQFNNIAKHDLNGMSFNGLDIKSDLEFIPFKNKSLDLILSCGVLAFSNDIIGILKQWFYALKPDGVFIANFLGQNSFIELKEMFFLVYDELNLAHEMLFAPSISTKDAGNLLYRAGFNLPVADKITVYKYFDSLIDILRFINSIGGYKYTKHNKINTKILRKIENKYFEKYCKNNKLEVSIDIIGITGWSFEKDANYYLEQNRVKQIGFI